MYVPIYDHRASSVRQEEVRHDVHMSRFHRGALQGKAMASEATISAHVYSWLSPFGHDCRCVGQSVGQFRMPSPRLYGFTGKMLGKCACIAPPGLRSHCKSKSPPSFTVPNRYLLGTLAGAVTVVSHTCTCALGLQWQLPSPRFVQNLGLSKKRGTQVSGPSLT